MTSMILVIVLALVAVTLAIRRVFLHRRHARADERETQARVLRHSLR